MNSQQKERFLLYIITVCCGALFSVLIWQAQRVIGQLDRVNNSVIELQGRFVQFQRSQEREQDQIIRRMENLEVRGK